MRTAWNLLILSASFGIYWTLTCGYASDPLGASMNNKGTCTAIDLALWLLLCSCHVLLRFQGLLARRGSIKFKTMVVFMKLRANESQVAVDAGKVTRCRTWPVMHSKTCGTWLIDVTVFASRSDCRTQQYDSAIKVSDVQRLRDTIVLRDILTLFDLFVRQRKWLINQKVVT